MNVADVFNKDIKIKSVFTHNHFYFVFMCLVFLMFNAVCGMMAISKLILNIIINFF